MDHRSKCKTSEEKIAKNKTNKQTLGLGENLGLANLCYLLDMIQVQFI